MGIKVLTVVGARPQFIKAAAVSRAMRSYGAAIFNEILLHTGQHYDDNMSGHFFDELDIPKPKYNLGIGATHHGAMTGKMLEGIEQVLLQEKPDWLLVYGDTNSTLAGALAAAKLLIPVAHVEAGLRSFNLHMAEEINRLLTDRISKLLFCPTKTAVANLAGEGLTEGVHLCGDVMYDASLFYRDRAKQKSAIMQKLGLQERQYTLVTIHRAENTDNSEKLHSILQALTELSHHEKIVMPLHPRTRKMLAGERLLRLTADIIVVDPLPYLDMIRLEQSARVILTDSGGVQKEAFFYGTPCVTIRDETEWVETVELGFNRLTETSVLAILDAHRASAALNLKPMTSPYGDGKAAHHICSTLMSSDSPEVESYGSSLTPEAGLV